MARNTDDYTVTQAAAIKAQRKARSAMSRALTAKLTADAAAPDSEKARKAGKAFLAAELHFAKCKREARLLTGADKPSGSGKAAQAKFVSEARKADADHAAAQAAQEKANVARAREAAATVKAREAAAATVEAS